MAEGTEDFEEEFRGDLFLATEDVLFELSGVRSVYLRRLAGTFEVGI